MERPILQLLLRAGYSDSELPRHHLDQRHQGALEQLASPSYKLADAPLLSNRAGLLLAPAVLDGDSAIGLVGDDYSSHHNNHTRRGIVSDQLHEDWMLNLSTARLR